MESEGVNKGVIVLTLIALVALSLVLFSEGVNLVGYAVVDSDINVDAVSTSSLDLGIEGIKTVVIPGQEKSLTISVQNNGDRTVNKCQLRCEGSAYCESTLVSNIDSGEIIDFPLIVNIVDEIPTVNVECVEGRRGIDVQFVLYTLDINAEILNVNFDGDDLIVNCRIHSDIDSEEVLTFRVTDNAGNLVKSVEKELSCEEGSSIETSIRINLDDAKDGVLNVGVLRDGGVLVEDTVIYGQSSVDVTDSGIFSIFSRGTYVYIFILVLIFLAVASMLIFKIIKNVHEGRAKKGSKKRKKK